MSQINPTPHESFSNAGSYSPYRFGRPSDSCLLSSDWCLELDIMPYTHRRPYISTTWVTFEVDADACQKEKTTAPSGVPPLV